VADVEAPIVGRTVERMALVEHLQQLLGGQGGVAIIEGEAGLGKSRLIEELLQQAQSLSIESLVGGGDAIEQSTPYCAWRPIFSTLIGEGLLRDTQVRLKTLKHLGLDQKWLHFLPLLDAVLPLELPDNDVTSQMTGRCGRTTRATFCCTCYRPLPIVRPSWWCWKISIGSTPPPGR
jgi:hypothetical protein